MNRQEYNKLENMCAEKEKIITAYDLEDQSDRTLLYGYTCDRDTWHVYLQKNHIYTVIYEFEKEPEDIEIFSNKEYVPNKRLYPERCDYEFCKLLKQKGISLPFTTWIDNVPKKIYYGKTS